MGESAITTRPLTQQERAVLAGYSGSRGLREDLSTAAGCTGFLALAAYAGISAVWRMLEGCDCSGDRQGTILIAAGVLALVLSAGVWRDVLRTRSRGSGIGTAADRDLARGEVVVETATVVRHVDVGEFEDEGQGFFIELADGRVLTLIDQDFYPYAQGYVPDPGEPDVRGTFPSRQIAWATAPESGIVVSTEARGAPLRAVGWTETQARHFPSAGSRSPVRAPVHGEIDEGPLEAAMARRGYTLYPFT